MRSTGRAAARPHLPVGQMPDRETGDAMFIQTEATPNPATLKFLPGSVVMPSGTFDARSADEGVKSPLAQRLFAIPGVAGVFFGYDFITVTKSDGEWQAPQALDTRRHHGTLHGRPAGSGRRCRPGANAESGEGVLSRRWMPTRSALPIKELSGNPRAHLPWPVTAATSPSRGYRDGVVYLRHEGACAGCPVPRRRHSSTAFRTFCAISCR